MLCSPEKWIPPLTPDLTPYRNDGLIVAMMASEHLNSAGVLGWFDTISQKCA